MDDLTKLSELIHGFRDLPHSENRAETFLEITGYPHLENVASNILEFFFDPTREHNLGTIFLEALLTAADQRWNPKDLQNVQVEREVSTKLTNRIDLVITTNAFVIGVENKLFSPVTNNLFDYQKHIQECVLKLSETEGSEFQPIQILLSLYPHKGVVGGDFQNITYEQFFKSLLSKLGSAILVADLHYLPLLIDFVNTINNLQEDNQMETDPFHEWIGEHKEEVENLLKSVKEYRQKLKTRIKILNSMVDVSDYKNKGVSCEQWFWDPPSGEILRTLVYDIKVPPDINLAINTYLSPKGWEIEVFSRDHKDSTKVQDLSNWLVRHGIVCYPRDGSPILRYGETKEFSTSEAVVGEELQGLLNQILIGIENDCQ